MYAQDQSKTRSTRAARYLVGVSLSLIALGAANAAPASCAADQTTVDFRLTQRIDSWRVPDGIDRIRLMAGGASGGDFYLQGVPSEDAQGGQGAEFDVELNVTPEQSFEMLVGGEGETMRSLSSSGGGGGGGGTVVATPSLASATGDINALVVVAGGGGGAAGAAPGGAAGVDAGGASGKGRIDPILGEVLQAGGGGATGQGGQIEDYTQPGIYIGNGGGGAMPNSDGLDNQIGPNDGNCGGGGLLGRGGDEAIGWLAGGGGALLYGGAAGDPVNAARTAGGFGGGGCGGINIAPVRVPTSGGTGGGGGGGYAGGAGGLDELSGGGASSFLTPGLRNARIRALGTNEGNGYVRICHARIAGPSFVADVPVLSWLGTALLALLIGGIAFRALGQLKSP
jgi:hypothetical protein